MLRTTVSLSCAALTLWFNAGAEGGVVFNASHSSGLSAVAEFSLTSPTTLVVRLKNTSTGAPAGFSGADQLLTGVSWDFDAPGANAGDISILSGSAITGPSSSSLNFSIANVGPGGNVSGEWGFGNGGSGLALTNFISANTAGSTPLGDPNLDGPSGLAGPSGGLVSASLALGLGGQAAIKDEIYATLQLSKPLASLNALGANSVRFEFGSDAMFLTVPAPGAAAMAGIVAFFAVRRRR